MERDEQMLSEDESRVTELEADIWNLKAEERTLEQRKEQL